MNIRLIHANNFFPCVDDTQFDTFNMSQFLFSDFCREATVGSFEFDDVDFWRKPSQPNL